MQNSNLRGEFINQKGANATYGRLDGKPSIFKGYPLEIVTVSKSLSANIQNNEVGGNQTLCTVQTTEPQAVAIGKGIQTDT